MYSSSIDATTSGYREELVPVESIANTNLFTGLPYRLHHVNFGKAPIAATETPEGLEVGGSRGPYHKLPYRIVAERRQSQWPKYR